MNSNGKPTAERDAIGGDRRQNRRYHLQLELKWKLIKRRRVLDMGAGRTVDFSSGGILLDAGCQLPEGLTVELSISWPVLLHNVAPLQLITIGKIVRGDGRRVAIRTVQHEFRTTGVQPQHSDGLQSDARPPQALLLPRQISRTRPVLRRA